MLLTIQINTFGEVAWSFGEAMPQRGLNMIHSNRFYQVIPSVQEEVQHTNTQNIKDHTSVHSFLVHSRLL